MGKRELLSRACHGSQAQVNTGRTGPWPPDDGWTLFHGMEGVRQSGERTVAGCQLIIAVRVCHGPDGGAF